MNTEVNLKLAKLLKEKEFDKKCLYYFHSNFGKNYEYEEKGEESGLQTNWNKIKDYPQDFISRPTITDVVMWLYEKHGVWIEVRHIKTFGVNRFHIIIWDYKNTEDYITIHCDNGVGYKVWDTPTEAYEAAIEYCLTKLI